jgi:hypothetical protein
VQWLGADQLLVGGALATIGGDVVRAHCRLRTPCPARVVPFGAGCASSTGTQAALAATAPWLGSTLVVSGTALPEPAVVVTVVGLQSGAVPLGGLLPLVLPHCSLFVAPDLLAASFVVGGATAWQLALPEVPTLVGVVLHAQLVALELGAAQQLTAVSSSAALRCELGRL